MTTNELTKVRQETEEKAHERTLILAIGGGLAFWAANFATSLTPIAAEYRAALSISYVPMVLVESLLGGLIIGCFVSYSLVRVFDGVPSKNPIVKSVILSLVALLIIEAFSTLVNLNNLSSFDLVGAIINLPRFLALAIVIGYLYDRPIGRGLRASLAK